MVFSWNGLFSPSLWGTLLFFVAGLALICFAGDKFVDAAVAIAIRLKIPQIVVGATVVSLGTTLPEILVSSTAVLGAAQSPDSPSKDRIPPSQPPSSFLRLIVIFSNRQVVK